MTPRRCQYVGTGLLAASIALVAFGVGLSLLTVVAAALLHATALLQTRTRKPVTVAKRAKLMTEAEFATACEKLLRVKSDEHAPLPDALPEGLRDPGFARSYEGSREQARAMAKKQLDQMLGDRFGYFGGGIELRRRLEERAAEASPCRYVADRSFTPHTHCPAGHIATHHVTGRDVGEGTVQRECWWSGCGLVWHERAWSTDEVVA